MAQAKLIRILTLFVLCFPQIAFGASAWLPKNGEYVIGISFSQLSSFSKEVEIEIDIYEKLEFRIAELYLIRSDLIEKISKYDYVTNQKIEIIDKKIKSLRKRQEDITKDFVKNSQNYYFERGINSNNSMGFSATASSSIGFVGSSKKVLDLEIFGKRKLYENKQWIFSGEYGFRILNLRDNDIYPMLRLNSAHVKTTKFHRKLISEADISIVATGNNHVESNIRQTIEFSSGYMLQVSTYYAYKENYNLNYRYFWRDQFTVAKKLSDDIISHFGLDTISVGLYQDYFHKKRKRSGNGIFCGVWFRA